MNPSESRQIRFVMIGAVLLGALFTLSCVQEPDGIVFPCVRPQVAFTNPGAGDTVYANVPITATFDTAMDSTSFGPGSVRMFGGPDTLGTALPGTLEFRRADSTVVFTPADSLVPESVYTVVIAPWVRDAHGVRMDTAYTWTFYTSDSLPAAPLLDLPGDSATGVAPLTTPFSWFPAARAQTYRLQVSTTPTFATTVSDVAGITGTGSTVVGLLPLSTYYWRVSAANPRGAGPWSSVRIFNTLP